MKTKKILLTIGIPLATIAPAISLVACGTKENGVKATPDLFQYNFKASDVKTISAGTPMINPLFDERVKKTVVEYNQEDKIGSNPLVAIGEEQHPNPDYKFTTEPLTFTKYNVLDIDHIKGEIAKLEKQTGNKITKIDLSQLLKLGTREHPLFIQNEIWELFPNLEEILFVEAKNLRIDKFTFLMNTNLEEPKVPLADTYYGGFLDNLPSTLKTIGDKAFFLGKLRTDPKSTEEKHKKLTLPDGLLSIGVSAFEGNRLQDLVLPDSVTRVEKRAFFGNELKTVKLSTSMDAIAFEAFAHNRLETIVLHDGIKEIMPAAFRDNLLTSVTLPKTLEAIHSSTFRDNLLETIKLPSTLRLIDSNAFYNNKFLDIAIPDSVVQIGAHAFASNKYYSNIGTNVTKLKLSSNLIRLGREAFAQDLIEEVTLPDSLDNKPSNDKKLKWRETSIGAGVFKDNKIKTVNFGKNLYSVPDEFFQHNLISDLNMADSIEIIGKNAFANNKIKTITFGDNIKTIKSNAFSGNLIEKLAIPDSVTTIEDGAFALNMTRDNTGLQDASKQSIFENNTTYKTIKIPNRFIPRFKEIFGMDPSKFETTASGTSTIFKPIASKVSAIDSAYLGTVAAGDKITLTLGGTTTVYTVTAGTVTTTNPTPPLNWGSGFPSLIAVLVDIRAKIRDSKNVIASGDNIETVTAANTAASPTVLKKVITLMA